MPRGDVLESATVGGEPAHATVIAPVAEGVRTLPFGGPGDAPPARGGALVELRLAAAGADTTHDIRMRVRPDRA
jgi:hypothetical protein